MDSMYDADAKKPDIELGSEATIVAAAGACTIVWVCVTVTVGACGQLFLVRFLRLYGQLGTYSCRGNRPLSTYLVTVCVHAHVDWLIFPLLEVLVQFQMCYIPLKCLGKFSRTYHSCFSNEFDS